MSAFKNGLLAAVGDFVRAPSRVDSRRGGSPRLWVRSRPQTFDAAQELRLYRYMGSQRSFRTYFETLAARFRTLLPGVVSSRGLPHVIAVLSIGLLSLVSFLLWLELRRRFPVIEAGSYFGSIEGVFSSSNVETPS